ncbi:PD-(D/E)XK motif protein [Micromonospora sp. NPDC048170]|uniref:PD-(D/E)XK motif protein n=1 Tax=Micromonospora sp. NPDC048170 TaxID=3154819 RepID=UPI00340D6CF1
MTERSEHLFALLEDNAPLQDIRIRYTNVHVPGGRVGHAVGRDGRRHLLVPLASGDNRTEDRTSRGVTITVRRLADNGRSSVFLDVACELAEMRDLFAEVCDEMLQRLEAAPGIQPGPVCRGVLQRWRELLAPAAGELLGRDRLAGLLAELHFLELAAAIDPDLALATWTGPDNARIDFIGNSAGVEVKATTAREQLRVEIHGLRQLDPGPLDELYLYVEQLESVPFGGDCVPDAVERLGLANVDTVRLLQALARSGYRHTAAESYRLVRFRRLQQRTFRTTSPGFPRLVPADLREPTLPDRISRVRYTIDLTGATLVPGFVDGVDQAVMHLIGTPQ